MIVAWNLLQLTASIAIGSVWSLSPTSFNVAGPDHPTSGLWELSTICCTTGICCSTQAAISSESWPSSNFDVINSTRIDCDFLTFLIQLTQREKSSSSIQRRHINILNPVIRLFRAVEFDRFNPLNDSRIVPFFMGHGLCRESMPSNSFSVGNINFQEFLSKISEDFISTFFYYNFSHSTKLQPETKS